MCIKLLNIKVKQIVEKNKDLFSYKIHSSINIFWKLIRDKETFHEVGGNELGDLR